MAMDENVHNKIFHWDIKTAAFQWLQMQNGDINPTQTFPVNFHW